MGLGYSRGVLRTIRFWFLRLFEERTETRSFQDYNGFATEE